MRYAQNTSVSVDKSKAEVEMILSRYGADQFLSGWDRDQAYIGFRLENRMIKFVVPASKEFTRIYPHGIRAPAEKSKCCPGGLGAGLQAKMEGLGAGY